MAPSERTSTNNTSKTTRTTRRTTKTKTTRRTRQQSRKEENDTKSKQLECFSTQDSSIKDKDLEISEVIDVSNNNNSTGSCCSTPKGKKFKIPEISTCPPAPKKQRVLSNFSLRRSPLSFFVPPDLEHFFMVAST